MIRQSILALSLLGFSGGIAAAAPAPTAAPVKQHTHAVAARPHVGKAAEPAPMGDSKPATIDNNKAESKPVAATKDEGAAAKSETGTPAGSTKKAGKKGHKAKADPAAAGSTTPPVPSADKAVPAPAPSK